MGDKQTVQQRKRKHEGNGGDHEVVCPKVKYVGQSKYLRKFHLGFIIFVIRYLFRNASIKRSNYSFSLVPFFRKVNTQVVVRNIRYDPL